MMRARLLNLILLAAALVALPPAAWGQEAAASASQASQTQPADPPAASSQSTDTAPASSAPDASQAASEPASEPASQPADESLAASELTAEALALRIQQIENSTDLPEASRVEIAALYKQAREQLAIADAWKAKLDDYERRISEAPADLEAARSLTPAATQPADPAASVEALTTRMAEAEAALRVEQEQQRQLDTEARSREERRKALPDLISSTLQRRDDAGREPGAAAAADANPLVIQARRTLAQARQRAVDAEVAAYQREQAFYAARGDILKLRLDHAKARVRAFQEQVNAVNAALAAAREREVAQQRAQVEAELQRAPPAVRAVASRNAELAKLRDEVTPRISAARDKVTALTARLDEVKKLLDKLKDTTQFSAQGSFVGQSLRQTAGALNDLRDLPVQMQRIQREQDTVAGQTFQIERELDDLETPDELVQKTVAELGGDAPAGIVDRIRKVYQTRQELLDGLQKDYRALAEHLANLLRDQVALWDLVQQANTLIAEKKLWVRSSDPLYRAKWPDDLSQTPATLQRLGAALLRGLWTNPTPDLAFVLLFLALIALRVRLTQRLRDLAQRVGSAFTDHFRHTLAAAVCTVLLVLPIPLLLWYLAWRLPLLATGDPTDVLAAAIGQGLARAALVFAIYSLIQQVCRPAGLGEAHFRWDRNDLRLVRREVSWLKWVSAPVVTLVAACEQLPDEGWRDVIGRLLFLAGLAALFVFLLRLLHPRSGLGASRSARARTSLFERTRTFWWVMGVLLPPALMVLSTLGFHETALVILRLIVRTIWLLLGLMLVQSVLVRWLFVAQRRIALEQARRRAAEAQAEAEAAGAEGGEVRPQIDEKKLDLVSLGDQTRQLLRAATAVGFLVGVWLIWADVLPALRILDAVQIGSYPTEVSQKAADGTEQVVTTMQRVTLTHVAMATLIAFLTFVLAKNVPGLIEIILLQKLPIDAGGRYAVTAIARYVITGVGVAMAFSAVGVAWSQVQWLVAAISVGLGFGLQEIFANFVSGLMLLFERPIRIGDIVTVGNVSGVVTRIQIRATTIRNWDRQELIIPNKEFVTGQVINWTLSDTVMRVPIQVGVAYGSDTRRVQAELLRIATECPLILADPPVQVAFTNLGDSALQFELRAFAQVTNMVDARTDLLHTIERDFKQMGIEIVFPQREVWLRRKKG